MGLWDNFDIGNDEIINDTLVIELGVEAQKMPEVQEAMRKELLNMVNYGVFGNKVKGKIGMNIVGTRFVNTKGEVQDGQKTKFKSRLVCQGYKELDKAQSDSPNANRESLRLFLSLSAVLGFRSLTSMDVSAAFLQANDIRRDVYVKLPKSSGCPIKKRDLSLIIFFHFIFSLNIKSEGSFEIYRQFSF